MKKNQLFSFAIALLIMSVCTSTIVAQVYNPPGQSTFNNHASNQSQLLINATSDVHTNNGNDVFSGIGIQGGNNTYGARYGLSARTTSGGAGSTGQSAGVARGQLAITANWFAQGAVVGVTGMADSVSVLNVTVANQVSGAYGGNFYTRIADPIQSPTVGSYYIGGSRNVLDGSITTYPTTGVVSAVIAEDRIKGSGTWAGHFDGRGHFSDKVGIKTLNPLSDLSVNGDGNANYTGYFYTDATINGQRAVFAEADRPIGFADRVAAITGSIESGDGYAIGTQGIASTANPSPDGRAYGVWGQAANADDGANYGVYGQLSGSNGGTAIMGYDEINFSNPSSVLMPAGTTWAGYFIGNSHFTNKEAIGTHTMPANTTVGGKDYLLYVCGGAMIDELRVQTGWCDYVFEEDYELTSLEDVEAHIEDKGYLHNTPSGEEIEENGLNVGALTANQQEKIEELYLHMIEMNKVVKELKVQNEALTEKVNLLKKK